MRADAVETPERREFLRMLVLQEKLAKGSDLHRRLFAQSCFDEVQRAHGGRLMARLRCEPNRPYTAGECYADILLMVHHFGLDIEAVLEALEEIMHKWSTDIVARLTTASDISAAKALSVRSAGSKLTL